LLVIEEVRPGLYGDKAHNNSPLLLGPIAHAIGVLKPISGITDGMIAFALVGLILLAIAHVMEIGRHMRQDQEDIL